MRAIRESIADGQKYPNKCFVPLHALRTERLGYIREYVICFQCASIEIYENGELSRVVTTSAHAKELFNSILVDAGIPLAPEKE